MLKGPGICILRKDAAWEYDRNLKPRSKNNFLKHKTRCIFRELLLGVSLHFLYYVLVYSSSYILSFVMLDFQDISKLCGCLLILWNCCFSSVHVSAKVHS